VRPSEATSALGVRSEELVEIKERALFIADSHYPHHGDDFLLLLQKLSSGEIQTPQLFLMGDNFDLLFGYNEYILKKNNITAINLLLSIAEETEVYYFEGNHDFCLKDIFYNIKVYPRDEQPVRFRYDTKKVAISHGDKYVTGFGYDLYCKLLRNKTTLKLLRPFEKYIIDDRMDRLSQKKICRPFHDFEKRVKKILSFYEDVDWVIEGHFHQAKKIGKYVSLPSLACQKEVGVLKNGDIAFVSISTLL